MESFRVYKPVISINEPLLGFQLTPPGAYTVELNVCNGCWLEESRILNELLRMRVPYFFTFVSNGCSESKELPAKLLDLIGVFLMGSSYARKNEQPVIGIREVNDNSGIIKKLLGYFLSQGFQDVCFLNFVEPKNYEIYLKEDSHLTITSIESINLFCEDISAIAGILNQYVYFKSDTLSNSLKLEDELRKKIEYFSKKIKIMSYL